MLRAVCALFCLCACALPVTAITIGPGSGIGTDLAGWFYQEEFQDWVWSDVRALDAADDVYASGDGYDDARDLLAFYHRYEGDDVHLRVDLLDLRTGWQGNMNLYIAIDCALGGALWLPDFLDVKTGNPWEICLALYADGDIAGSTYNIYDSAYGTAWNSWFGGSYWNTDLDAVELTIPRDLLQAAGWDGISVVHFQVMTAKDFAETNCQAGDASSDLTDAIIDDDRGCSDGELNGAIRSDDQGGRVQYASIAHGNQSLNRASELMVHVHDPEWNTGIPGGTGFIRTLDTHRIFSVPLNIHASGTLLSALQWAVSPDGPGDPADGPTLLNEIRLFADTDQNDRPGALIGGVFAEHILPYFEGPVNAASFAVADTLHEAMFGLDPSDIRVMHVPERVIRSLPTGFSPLDGFTFEDILAAGYDATYLDSAGGVTGNEQSFYDLVPVISGEQGDYRVRGVGPEADGPPIPSGTIFGDLNSLGTLLHDTWAAIENAPDGGLKFLAQAAYTAMIYETAWHEEDATDYTDSDGFGNWLYPDGSWDGLSGWALRLHNHTRDAASLAAAAAWADSVRHGDVSSWTPTASWSQDTDLDGEDEVILRNGLVWTLWQARGGRCLLAVRYDPDRQDAVLLMGNPLGLTASSGNGLVTMTHTLPTGSDTLSTLVNESVSGALYVRFGLNPDLQRLLISGPSVLTRSYDGGSLSTSNWYRLETGGVNVAMLMAGSVFVESPLNTGFERRDLGLTEELEIFGDGIFGFHTVFGTEASSTEVVPAPVTRATNITFFQAAPNPFNPRSVIQYELKNSAMASMRVMDLRGRVVVTLLAKTYLTAGHHTLQWDGNDSSGRSMANGTYVVVLEAGAEMQTLRVMLVE